MRVILFLLFIYMVVRIVRLMLVQNRGGRSIFNRTYTFRGSSNPFGNVRQPNGNASKKQNIDNLEDAEFEEIDDDK
ncbi:MAG: hypothetical protein WEB89_04590 [Balneolales bacterium]